LRAARPGRRPALCSCAPRLAHRRGRPCLLLWSQQPAAQPASQPAACRLLPVTILIINWRKLSCAAR
jgi:hypothetical protein